MPEARTNHSRNLLSGLQNKNRPFKIPFLPEHNGGPVLRVSADGLVLFANTPAQELLSALGWSRGKLIPKLFLDSALEALSRREIVRAQLGSGELAHSFFISAHPATRHVNFYGHRIGGALPDVLSLLEAIPNLVCSLNPDGKAIYVNRLWRDYTGLDLDQLNRLGWETLYHPDEAPQLKSLFNRATRTGTSFEAEFRYRRHDGAYRWFLGHWVAVQNPRGEVGRWVSSWTDIDERKRAQTALESAQAMLKSQAKYMETVIKTRTEQLRNSLEESQAFAHSVAHDLRGPIYAIDGLAKAVLEDCGDVLGDHGEYVRRISTTARNMESFVDALLELGRAGHRELDLQPLDLIEIIRDLVLERRNFQPPLAHIELPDSPVLVRGDLPSLVQCVTNLLGNAVKFVRPGVVPHVRIHSQPNGTHVRVFFEDNGIGVQKKYHKTIFAPFQRSAGSSYEGHGLGLTIVHRAVTRMNGQVGVQSEPGNGSRFWVDLPKG